MGVNYRHSFHAGNPADVLKHALLVGLVRALQRKETGFLFVDTHAGRGRYDLSLAAEGDTRPRRPEWPGGIGALWDRTDSPPEVADYLGIVRAFDRDEGNLAATPRFYPGSPRIARALAREQDRLALWEKQPAECAALRGEFKGVRRVSIHADDGYGAIRACLPPRERRALVLIDPPYESQGEWAAVSAAVAEGVGRFPGGTLAVWYPLTERAGAEGFLDSVRALGVPSLTVELVTDPMAVGMRGSGVAVINPPWQFEAGASSTAAYLAASLARGAAHGSLRWIVPR
jgi:23S rRNA (adenine2030-N6)-methyltransferase